MRNEQTVTEAATELVAKKAHDLLWAQMGSERGLTETELRVRVWQSPEGRELVALTHSPYAHMPASVAKDRIRKDGYGDHYSGGLRVLREGFPS